MWRAGDLARLASGIRRARIGLLRLMGPIGPMGSARNVRSHWSYWSYWSYWWPDSISPNANVIPNIVPCPYRRSLISCSYLPWTSCYFPAAAPNDRGLGLSASALLSGLVQDPGPLTPRSLFCLLRKGKAPSQDSSTPVKSRRSRILSSTAQSPADGVLMKNTSSPSGSLFQPSCIFSGEYRLSVSLRSAYS
jgi:hypothetical protein